MQEEEHHKDYDGDVMRRLEEFVEAVSAEHQQASYITLQLWND